MPARSESRATGMAQELAATVMLAAGDPAGFAKKLQEYVAHKMAAEDAEAAAQAEWRKTDDLKSELAKQREAFAAEQAVHAKEVQKQNETFAQEHRKLERIRGEQQSEREQLAARKASLDARDKELQGIARQHATRAAELQSITEAQEAERKRLTKWAEDLAKQAEQRRENMRELQKRLQGLTIE